MPLPAPDPLLHPALPFTERELARAFRLLVPPPKAARLARQVARTATHATEWNAAAARSERQAGISAPAGTPLGHVPRAPASFYVSDGIYALLALASPALAGRVEHYWAEATERDVARLRTQAVSQATPEAVEQAYRHARETAWAQALAAARMSVQRRASARRERRLTLR